MPVVYLGAEEGRAAFDAQQAQEAAEAQTRSDIAAGQQAIRDAKATLDAVIAAARDIEDFAGASLTQAQIIATFKQLATGVRLLAQGEKLALSDIGYLARLELRDFDED